jgi:LPPG:FO 2-phospho-L-lactate transferase
LAREGVTVLAGGVGAARLLAGMVDAVPADQVTAVVNVGDDMELHGLHISPDIDTVIYTVAEAIDPDRGRGLAGESWHAMEALERYGGESWFSLGDRDLATHLHRTQRLSEGASLSTVTAELAGAWGLDLRVLPATDDRLRTMITLLPDAGQREVEEVTFQDYFVRRGHAVPVAAIRLDGATEATPAPGVLDALNGAAQVIVAPSNPLVSISPVLAVPAIRAAVEARRSDVVAISPIVGGRALKGPADRMLRELGHEPSVIGIARLYAPLAGALIIDEADREHRAAVEAEGLDCLVTDTIMTDREAAATLSRTALDF